MDHFRSGLKRLFRFNQINRSARYSHLTKKNINNNMLPAAFVESKSEGLAKTDLEIDKETQRFHLLSGNVINITFTRE